MLQLMEGFGILRRWISSFSPPVQEISFKICFIKIFKCFESKCIFFFVKYIIGNIAIQQAAC